MPANETSNSALVLDFRAEGLISLCEEWERDALTISEFNEAYSAFCATAPDGCCNKVFGTLAFRDEDADRSMSAGANMGDAAFCALFH
jgi:hypothetical protein